MNAPFSLDISRRSLLAGGGALIVSFTLLGAGPVLAQKADAGPELPADMLDSWLRIDAQGIATVFTGRSESGQGVKTAMIALAAEELYLDPLLVKVITSDTEKTPNEGYTSGSKGTSDGGGMIRAAAAQVRSILVKNAAGKLGVDAAQLKLDNGKVVAPDGKSISYGELVAGDVIHVELDKKPKLKDPKSYSIVSKGLARVDIPAKVTGGEAFLHDMRLPGMVHARIVRPPSYSAKLLSVDAAKVEKLPGVLKVVRDGSYLAVIAEKEFQAVTAMQALAKAAQWEEKPTFTDYAGVYEWLQTTPSEDVPIFDTKTTPEPGTKTVEVKYTRPYQMHGSIGPSCSVAHYQDGKLKLWVQNQGAYPMRQAVAEMLKMQEADVHCVHVEGAGCYGHNGADDAGGDAALIAFNFPGRPVRLQYMRADEHGWEPYGSAMVAKARVSLDGSGKIVDWNYDVYSTTHGTRPGGAKSLAAAWYREQPLKLSAARAPGANEADGNRNSKTTYKLPCQKVVHHHIKEMPLRVSALRSLGAYMNVFSNESLMDEVALAAGGDPVEFRRRDLDDQRSLDVINGTVQRFGWNTEKLPKGRGRGFAFVRYRNSLTYVAIATEVEIDASTGAVRIPKVVATVDSGTAVLPDGVRNQIEGGIIQSISWTLHEQVGFDKTRITSRDWMSYPILRFNEMPEVVDVEVINRPGQPILGAGEASQGPAAASLANAIAHATGTRLRDLPLTRDRVKAAMQA